MRIFQVKVLDTKIGTHKVYVRESGIKKLDICTADVFVGTVNEGKNFQYRIRNFIEQEISDRFFKGEGRLDKDFSVNISYE